jgi:triacylglycerol lipase
VRLVSWWGGQYDGVAKARRIITLGSPLHGADLAAVGAADAPDACPAACPAACQELVPGSSMLHRLQVTGSATRPPWLSLWTTDDQVVQPPDSARPPGAVNVPRQSVCPGVSIGHGQLPTDPLVVGIVLRTLRSAALSLPRPADCRSLQARGASGS